MKGSHVSDLTYVLVFEQLAFCILSLSRHEVQRLHLSCAPVLCSRSHPGLGLASLCNLQVGHTATLLACHARFLYLCLVFVRLF